MSDSPPEYVTNDAWVRTVGRPDAIDDVADQFERRLEPLRAHVVRWPERSRGWDAGSPQRRTA